MAKKVSDQLRAAVESSGMTRYAICKAIGMDQAVMSRFMGRTGGLSTEMTDRLCKLLELKLVGAVRLPPSKEK